MCCATRTICTLDMRIDIKLLVILYLEYTDEAMTLVHINGPRRKKMVNFYYNVKIKGGAIQVIKH